MRADIRRFVASGLFLVLVAGAPLAAHAQDAAPAEGASPAVAAPAPEALDEPAAEPTEPTPTTPTATPDDEGPDDAEPSPQPSVPPTEPAPADPATAVKLTNAQLRWSLNTLLHRKPHDGKNFLSAGLLPDTKGERMLSTLWKQSEDNVRIERAAGTTYAPATWDGFGVGVDHQVVIDGGTGTVDAATNTARIVWRGSFGVARYSGMTAFSVTDPVLVVDKGVGRLEASLSGFGVSRDGNGAGGASGPIGPSTVVLADLGAMDLSNPAGLTKTPAFYGVRVAHPEQKADVQGRFGSFPADFISFVDQVGQAPFWMTSGSDDDAKAAAPVAVSFDATAPLAVAPPKVTPEAKKPKVSNPTKKAPPAKPSTAPAPIPVPLAAPLPLPEVAAAPTSASVPVSVPFVNTASLTAASPTVLVDPDGDSSDLGWWIAATFLLMSAVAVAAPSLLARPRAV